jgi:hypothetical protein
MPYRICWEQRSVDQILQTEALAGNDAVFLATHSPIEGFEVSGSRASEVVEATEECLFEALSAYSTRHAFCVVRGEPGSGKSHLIRWLSIQWKRRQGSDLVILVQRADGSLQNTLEQLRKVLPVEEDASLWQGIATSDGIRFEGRAKLFHDALGHSLGANFLEEEKEDQQWCVERDLSDLLLAPEVRDGWKAPLRILEIVSGNKGERNSELAQFVVQDIRDLLQLGQSIEKPKRAHIRFLMKLDKELKALADPANAGKPTSDVAPDTFRFLRALNERLNPAIQRFLGISPHGLKELFRRLRRKLREENRRLVLLLEDITSFQGVDNLLIDVLVTDSQTRQDECDLISVVGLTPSYFDKFIGGLGNIVARVTHMIRLSLDDHGFEKMASLGGDSSVRFVAKYLNAVRLGVDRLRDGSNVPNACEGCPDQAACHRSFGFREGYGLYPLTETFITRNYERLIDPEGKLTQQTPRGLLQNLVHPALFHVDDLERGEYPPSNFPVAPIRNATELAGPVRDRLTTISAEDDVGLSRLRMLVALWGNGGSSIATTVTIDGESEFSGIRESIFSTFQIPWPGTEIVAEPEPLRSSDPELPEEKDEQEQKGAVPRGPRQDKTSVSRPSKPPQTRVIKAGNLDDRLRQLDAWEDNRPLEDAPFWNQQMWLAISELPWAQMGIPYYLWRKLITANLVVLAGTGQARAGHLVIPREIWVLRGLRGFLNLRQQPDSQEIELSLRYSARFRRRLQQLVVAHVNSRMAAFRTESGEIWSPVHTAVQMLAARAWLRGDALPLNGEMDQWRTLLSDESEARTAPRQRVDTWSEFVDVTGYAHSKIREVLRDYIALPQSSEPGADLADAANGLRAIRDLVSKVAYTGLPSDALTAAGNQQISELVMLSERAMETETKLNGLPGREANRIRQRGEGVLEALRGSGFKAHVERIEGTLRSVLQYLHDAAPNFVQEWQQQLSRLRSAGYLTDPSPEIGELEDFLMSLEGEAPTEPARLLQWCLQAPVQTIANVMPALEFGEALVGKLAEYVSAYLGKYSGAGSANLETIQQTGKRLNEVARIVESRMRADHD